MSELQAPLLYPGSKWAIAPWIVERLPAHDAYVEPFCGSAAVLLSKPRSPVEVLNDIDGDVVNFFQVLRDQGDELVRLCELTPYSRTEYQTAFEPVDDPVERARRLAVRSWQTRGGYRRCSASSWGYNRGPGRSNSNARRWLKVPGRLRATVERLHGVFIECDDWREIVRRFDAPGTLFYVDPPYLGTERARPMEYVHEMREVAQHEELLDVLGSIRGMALLSGYRSPLYEGRLSGWRRYETTSCTRSGALRSECLWLSPAASSRGFQRELWL